MDKEKITDAIRSDTIPVRVEIMVNGLVAANERRNAFARGERDALGEKFSTNRLANYFARRHDEAASTLLFCEKHGVVVADGDLWRWTMA